jgi:hypothetical protein
LIKTIYNTDFKDVNEVKPRTDRKFKNDLGAEDAIDFNLLAGILKLTKVKKILIFNATIYQGMNTL